MSVTLFHVSWCTVNHRSSEKSTLLTPQERARDDEKAEKEREDEEKKRCLPQPEPGSMSPGSFA